MNKSYLAIIRKDGENLTALFRSASLVCVSADLQIARHLQGRSLQVCINIAQDHGWELELREISYTPHDGISLSQVNADTLITGEILLPPGMSPAGDKGTIDTLPRESNRTPMRSMH